MLAYRLRHVAELVGLAAPGIAFIGLACIIISILALGRLDESDTLWKWLFFGEMIVFIYPIFTLTKNNKFDRITGELSYPMYITHGLVITLAAAALGLSLVSGPSLSSSL